MLVHLNSQEKVLSVNKITLNILEQTEDEMLGLNFIDAFVPEREWARMRDCFSKVIRGEEIPKDGFESYLLAKNGKERTICFHFAPLKDSMNEVSGILCTGEDITDRRRTERALELQKDDLAASNKELEQFASVIAHDLQEPIRTVTNWTDLFRKDFQAKLPTEANEYLEYIFDGSQRMSQLIQALLSFSRVNKGPSHLTASSFGQIVEEATLNLQKQIAESNAEIRVTTSLPILLVDQSQFVQAFQHLIGNAIKFRRLEVPCIILISAAKEDNAWRFSIEDTGIGIDRRHFGKIFEIFKRLHTREEYPGSGIGLSLVKKIVERHGGKINVTSEVGRGSTFSFLIPEAKEGGTT